MKRTVALLLIMICILSGCGIGTPAGTAAPTTEPVTAPATEATTEAATESVTEPATVATTEPTTVPTTVPPVVRHSGLNEDGSFNEGAWFIGDSLTYNLIASYLRPKEYLGDANYTAKCGAQITAFFDGTVMNRTSDGICGYRSEHYNMTYQQVALELGTKAKAIYVMFGTNHTKEGFEDYYRQMVDFLLEACPEATIHLQLIPWCGSGVYWNVNKQINKIYGEYESAGQQRVMLIDTFTGIGQNPYSEKDTIHLSTRGNRYWYNTIVAHAEKNGLMP